MFNCDWLLLNRYQNFVLDNAQCEWEVYLHMYYLVTLLIWGCELIDIEQVVKMWNVY